MGVLPVLFAFVFGTTLGVVAGYLGGLLANMAGDANLLDVFYAFPSVLLAVAVVRRARAGPEQQPDRPDIGVRAAGRARGRERDDAGAVGSTMSPPRA